MNRNVRRPDGEEMILGKGVYVLVRVSPEEGKPFDFFALAGYDGMLAGSPTRRFTEVDKDGDTVCRVRIIERRLITEEIPLSVSARYGDFVREG